MKTLNCGKTGCVCPCGDICNELFPCPLANMAGK